MSKVISIVIDADIARSSGTSEHPTSSRSRALLNNVSKHGHFANLCPILLGEWKNHRSLFAKKWLASMIARKKVNFINPEKQVGNIIKNRIVSESDQSVAIKDVHLVDAALASDKVIASNDNNSRIVFCCLADTCGLIKDVKWFNAVKDKEFLDQFLSQSCFIPKVYYLSS